MVTDRRNWKWPQRSLYHIWFKNDKSEAHKEEHFMVLERTIRTTRKCWVLMLPRKQVLAFTSECWQKNCLCNSSHRPRTAWDLRAERGRSWEGRVTSHQRWRPRFCKSRSTVRRTQARSSYCPASSHTMAESRARLCKSSFSDPTSTAAGNSGLNEFNQSPCNPVKWLHCTAVGLSIRWTW